MRPDHLGCYGYTSIETPNLDALATRGVRLAQAVTPVPLTLPSHASILTGTYPTAHGVRDMGGFVLGGTPPTTDAQLGRLMDVFRASGLESKTLFAVLGDHGESLGEHGETTHGIFLYVSTIKIPFILNGPGVPSGKVVERQVRSIELAPTLMAALNLPAGSQMQGAPLWPLMQDAVNLPPESRYAYLETIYPRTHMGWSELFGVRSQEWKYIRAPREEHYDLRNDPQESTDILTSNPAISARYKAILEGILHASRQGEVLTASPLSQETREELSSLGYLTAGTTQSIELEQSRPDPKTQVRLLRSAEKAIERMSRRDYPAAANLLEAAVAADATNPLFYLRLSICCQLQGNLRGAESAYERGRRHHAETDEIIYRHGNLLMDRREFRRAETAIQPALKNNANYPECLNNLAICYFELGMQKEAEQTFERPLEMGSGDRAFHEPWRSKTRHSQGTLIPSRAAAAFWQHAEIDCGAARAERVGVQERQRIERSEQVRGTSKRAALAHRTARRAI